MRSAVHHVPRGCWLTTNAVGLLGGLRSEFGPEETPKQAKHRLRVLEEIRGMFAAFCKQVAPSGVQGDAGGRGRVLTYGSYRLGVHTPRSDIDACVVVMCASVSCAVGSALCVGGVGFLATACALHRATCLGPRFSRPSLTLLRSMKG